MNKLSAVFWDVDGTIADTELCGHRVAFNLAFKDFELDWEWNKDLYLELLKVSGGLKRIIYYRDLINSELTNERCIEIQSRKGFYYKKLIEAGKIKVRQGVLRLIEELSDFNVDQFIVTTSGKSSLKPFLQTLLRSHLKFFTKTITYEDVRNHKPHPDAYNLAVKLSKQLKINCLVIEDSKIGIESAKAAGLNTLLTLPSWTKDYNNVTNKANSCVSNLGSTDQSPKLIYGKPLINNIVDFEYLKNIIN